jgi:hypothetical protein
MRVLLLLATLIVACGKSDDKVAVSSYRQSEVAAVRAQALSWYGLTDGAGGTTGVFSFEEGPQPNQGNANLWHGLLCYSGDTASCAVVQQLECGDHSLKRAPWRACNAYSRDELLGHMLMHATTGTKVALPGNSSSAYPFTMTPEMWFAAWRVGAPDKSAGRLYDEHALLAEASANPLGYRAHLIAVHLILRQRTGMWNSAYANAAKKLLSRQGDNVFYRWLVEGNTPRVIDAFLATVPKARPTQQRFWIWQEDSQGKMASAHGASIVFMANLLLR